jgi:UDP-sulfoquinovose synthase
MNEDTPDQGDSVALVFDRVRELHAILGLDDGVKAEEVSAVLTRYTRLTGIAGSELAVHLDAISTAVLIGRSTLGTPAARSVRQVTSADAVAAILRLSRQVDAEPGKPGEENSELANAETGVVGSSAVPVSAPDLSESPVALAAGVTDPRCEQSGRTQLLLAGGHAGEETAEAREHLRACAYCRHRAGLEFVTEEFVAATGRRLMADDIRRTVIPRILDLTTAVMPAAGRDEGAARQQRPYATGRSADSVVRVESAPVESAPVESAPVESAPGSAESRGSVVDAVNLAGTSTADEPRARVAHAGLSVPALRPGLGQHVLILGGDGFCGWPTAIYLSERGWNVTILDDLSRRKIDIDLEVQSLTPIRSIGERIRAWKEISGRDIGFVLLDLATEYERLASVLRDIRPDAIVHFAEQRAAPYSMRNTSTKRYTVDNNVRATHNLLTALVAADIGSSLVHLGTMGVYGYGWTGSAPIPEGYLKVKVPTPSGDIDREILHPGNPVSVYHLTKTLDQLMFAFYATNDGLRITDLHQGIVWGTQTDQTRRDERLINRFDYDGDYGTVLNRFLMQAALGHPLTVHGSGFQTRAFIHIQDTVRCIELALAHPPEAGSRPKVLNQVTETFRVLDLAKMVADMTGTDIAYLPNPRCEPDENDLFVLNAQFLALGLEPTRLSDGLLAESRDVATRYRDRVDPTKIVSRSVWRAGMETADDLLSELPVL